MKLLLLALCVSASSALYSAKDDVVELTAANFQSKVVNSDDIWIVEFYAPWCGHCKSLVPEYKKAATALKGIAKVGSVDMTQHQAAGAPYNVQGYPTLKIFGLDKKKPTDYQGARSAQGITDAILGELKKAVSARLGGKGSSGGSSSGKRGGGDSGNHVVELTDANVEQLVINSKDIWLIEFFAPWCGHCKNLEPHWKAAAGQLKGKVKLGALDATVHTTVAGKFGIRGFPTIKYFAPGSDFGDAQEYDGGRSTSDIVTWAEAKASENLPAPEVLEGIKQALVQPDPGYFPTEVRRLCPKRHLKDITSGILEYKQIKSKGIIVGTRTREYLRSCLSKEVCGFIFFDHGYDKDTLNLRATSLLSWMLKFTSNVEIILLGPNIHPAFEELFNVHWSNEVTYGLIRSDLTKNIYRHRRWLPSSNLLNDIREWLLQDLKQRDIDVTFEDNDCILDRDHKINVHGWSVVSVFNFLTLSFATTCLVVVLCCLGVLDICRRVKQLIYPNEFIMANANITRYAKPRRNQKKRKCKFTRKGKGKWRRAR